MVFYDTIGHGYRGRRRPDPRIAARLDRALEGCESIVNVGAGTGSYEPIDRDVVALDLSDVMLRQRSPEAAPAVRGSSAALPFGDDRFDASLAILTLHHWADRERGLAELRRVARRRVVLLTCEPALHAFWLTDYFPEIRTLDHAAMPAIATLERTLGPATVEVVPIPHDCTDGFQGAYWRRPEAYLDPDIRSGISTFAKLGDSEAGLRALARDLESGEWRSRYGALLDREELDLGYRIVVAQLASDTLR